VERRPPPRDVAFLDTQRPVKAQNQLYAFLNDGGIGGNAGAEHGVEAQALDLGPNSGWNMAERALARRKGVNISLFLWNKVSSRKACAAVECGANHLPRSWFAQFSQAPGM
jgi:hypothetical protein